MSVSRESGDSPMQPHGAVREGDRGSGRDALSGPISRQRSEEGVEVIDVDTNQLQHLTARPPPAMPLTPPRLSATMFSFQDRRPSMAVSVHGDSDPAFTQQTHSDSYSSDSMMTIHPNVRNTSPRMLRKKSYAKTLPLDTLHMSSTDSESEEFPSSAFAPSSFPSSNPIIPLAPHAALDGREIDVTGEILSVLDDSGAGWKRHTRVYGGGVCLACLASGAHGRDGGFYGENVPLDQRR